MQHTLASAERLRAAHEEALRWHWEAEEVEMDLRQQRRATTSGTFVGYSALVLWSRW